MRKPDKTYLYAKKSDIWHKIEKGILFDTYYDTETTDLDKRFSEITQFGGVITDVAGNVMHVAEHNGIVSPYTVISPAAWVIQRLHERKLDEGDPQYILAGKVMQFFRHANNLAEAPFLDDFLNICKKKTVKSADGGQETYYAYPLMDDNEELDWDCIRISENFKTYSYKNPSNGDWIKKSIASMSIGYNNVNADDQWIWTLLHMAGAENLFVTHLAQKGKFRLDALRAVETAYAAGPKGEKGIKAAKKKDPVTGLDYFAFSQGDILRENTRIGSEIRRVSEGITLPDGSYADIDQLHGAYKDAFALVGLVRYLRQQTPDILKEMEQNSVWKDVVERITEKQGAFGDHPILTYIDKSYPYLTGKMITLIGTDQYRHNPKLAMVYNLGIDPTKFRFNKKTLKDLTPEEHAHLIEKSRQDQNGIYKIIRTHHSPRLLPKEMGFKAGFNNDLTLPDLHERAKYLRDETLINNMMAGMRLAMPRLGGPERIALPQPEEELFTFSTLEMYDPDIGEDVQVHSATNRIEMLAQDSRMQTMKIKSFWLKAIEPDDDILLTDYSEDTDLQGEAVDRFLNKIKDLNKKLKACQAPLIPDSDRPVIDKESAMLYKLKILFTAHEHFTQGTIRDIGHHFWIEDKLGHRLPVEEVKKWPEPRIEQMHQSGNFRIVHETLNVTPLIIKRIIDNLGYGQLMSPQAQHQLDALKALKRHGIPALNGNDRWVTIRDARRQAQKIMDNELATEDVRALEKRYPGLWETMMTQHHDAQSSLKSYMNYLNKLSLSTPQPNEAQLISVGLSPVTGAPVEKIDYKLHQDKVIYINVPDRYLEDPPCSPITGKPTWIVDLTSQFNLRTLKKAVKSGKDIVLQGTAFSKKAHLPKANVQPPPKEGGVHSDFYHAVNARYQDSNLQFSNDNNKVALIGEGPHVLHDMQALPLPEQSLQVPKPHFEGLLDYKVASFAHPVRGIMVRDDALHLEEGPIKLLESDHNTEQPTGWCVNAHVSKAERVSLKDINKLSDDQATEYGFASQDAMAGAFSVLFADKKLKANDSSNKVWLINFDDINPKDPVNGTYYQRPDVQKVSALMASPYLK